ncbi:ATP phosphoribosyltransferase regulatory subunit [endosymbiont of unidentified scaly snail isolate Monju]|uniref:ATP phosphoribosyltransferase regulatory subunit n=1 Tax=endosymbiont of unidentified scaly snail isolate Monju TaxID=1248727 RepID=UPI0003892D6D|nr:ATP phosphoribosyltransferase regulatory subunit [endosymbiont of unidentified scaly snail isolate Monju]BAN68797.1 ATP phosphoribosyltransferase regulatory subunit [endosymbiont of unidentified scaly snail isolate Monju]
MNVQDRSWLLPEGIDELLPEQAAALEVLRRRLLDTYRSWGYRLVIPPVIEYLDSLLTGAGKDLELQTFQLTDQLSGRQLGIRADMTPQVARIDAHQLQQQGPTRLCYMGSVLRTRPDGFSSSRSPLQIGAELYGHAGIESDAEVLCLMMETLRIAGLPEIYLDLGHVGIFRGLARQAGLDEQQEAALFEALQRKARPEIGELVAGFDLPPAQAAMFEALADLNGDAGVLAHAREALAEAPQDVLAAIDYLEALGLQLGHSLPETPVHYDLAELRAYHYQTGVVFAAFVPGQGNEVARGGRYDHIGEKFGRARPATGFSADLKTLMLLGDAGAPMEEPAVLAPAVTDPALDARIRELRAAGRVVIRELPGQAICPDEAGIGEQLRLEDGDWVLRPYE